MQRDDHPNEKLPHRTKWVLIGFLIVAGYFLILEHRAHLSGALDYLPYLLLLACPLLHVFMHKGHTGHVGHAEKSGKEERK